jgi:ApeA-like protein/HEPN superfamily Apea-like protein
LKDKRKIEGRWWVFGAENPPHYGVLEFDPDKGLTLSVKIPDVKSFREVLTPPSTDNMSDVILGRDAHNKEITLFGCSSPSSTLQGGMTSHSFRPLTAIIGQTFARWSEITFSSVRVEYSLLHEWIGRSSLSVDLGANRATFDRAEDLRFELTPEVTLTLGAAVESTHDHSGLRVTEGHWAEYTFKTPISVDAIYDRFVVVLRRLLTLLTGKRVFAEAITFNNDKFELLQPNEGVQDADRGILANHMVASFSELGDGAGDALRRWFQYHTRLEPALNLYFATVFNRSLYSNHSFLFLAQALEVYHRMNSNFVGGVQPTSAFRDKVAGMLSNVPPADHAWIKEKLNFANEKTLAQRLEDILSTAPDEVAEIIPDRVLFAAKVRHTRNYYTHFSPELQGSGKAASDDELSELTEQMRGLFLLCILRDLGISGSPLRKVVHSVSSLQYVSLK